MSLNETKIIKKSRKEHMCIQCWQKIPKGSSYTLHYGVYDGDFFNNHAHNECFSLWEECNSDSRDDEWFGLDDCINYTDSSPNFDEWREQIRELYKLENPKIGS